MDPSKIPSDAKHHTPLHQHVNLINETAHTISTTTFTTSSVAIEIFTPEKTSGGSLITKKKDGANKRKNYADMAGSRPNWNTQCLYLTEPSSFGNKQNPEKFQFPKMIQEQLKASFAVIAYDLNDTKGIIPNSDIESQEFSNQFIAHRKFLLKGKPKITVPGIWETVREFCFQVLETKYQENKFSWNEFKQMEKGLTDAIKDVIDGLMLQDILANLRELGSSKFDKSKCKITSFIYQLWINLKDLTAHVEDSQKNGIPGKPSVKKFLETFKKIVELSKIERKQKNKSQDVNFKIRKNIKDMVFLAIGGCEETKNDYAIDVKNVKTIIEELERQIEIQGDNFIIQSCRQAARKLTGRSPFLPLDGEQKTLDLRNIVFPQLINSNSNSPKTSESRLSSPVSPPYVLPKEVLQKYKGNILTTHIERKSLNFEDLEELKNQEPCKEYNDEVISYLKNQLSDKKYAFPIDSPSRLIEIAVLDFCKDALWTSFTEGGITYVHYQESEEPFVSALIEIIQNKGILIKDILPKLIHLKNDLIAIILQKQKFTERIKKFYIRLENITAAGSIEGQTFELSHFLTISGMLLNQENNKPGLSLYTAFRNESPGYQSAIPNLFLSLLGGGIATEGQNVIDLLRKYGNALTYLGTDKKNDIKACCNAIAEQCSFILQADLRMEKCEYLAWIDHYHSDIGGKKVQIAPLISKPRSTSLPIELKKEDKRSSRFLKPLKSSGSNTANSRSDHESKSSSSNSLIRSFIDSDGSSSQSDRSTKNLHPILFGSTTIKIPFDLPKNIGAVKYINLASFNCNPISNALDLLKFAPFPTILVNGAEFYFIRQSYFKSEAEKELYCPKKDLFFQLFSFIYEKAGTIITNYEIQEQVNLLFRIADEQKKMTDRLFSSDEDRELGFLSYQPTCDLMRECPPLRITNLISLPSARMAIIYMSLLFPEFFPYQKTDLESGYIIPFDNEILEKTIQQYRIEIASLNCIKEKEDLSDYMDHYRPKDKYSVCQSGEVKVYRRDESIQPCEYVGTIQYTWNEIPGHKIKLKEVLPVSGWKCALKITGCQIENVDDKRRIKAILGNPKELKTHKDLHGVEFSTHWAS